MEPEARVDIRFPGMDGDVGALPFVVGMIGNFSGRRDPTEFLTSDFLVHSPRDPEAMFRRLRPSVRFMIEGLGDTPYTVVRLAFASMDDFSPGRICLSDGVPPLRAGVALRNGILTQARVEGPPPDLQRIRQGVNGLKRIVSEAAAQGGWTIPAPPSADGFGWADLVTAATGSLSAALFLRAAMVGERNTPQGEKLDALKRLDIDGVTADILVPALFKALSENGGRRPLPWARSGATEQDVFLATLMAAGTGELSAALAGSAPFLDGHAGWLAGRLEERAEGILSVILRHEDFRNVESCWRTVFHVAGGLRGRGVVLKILDAAKETLFADFEMRGREWNKSRLFELVHDQAYNSHGGIPFTLLHGLFDVDASRRDVTGLRVLSSLGAAVHCPIIVSASPTLTADAERWDGQGGAPRETAAWTALRRLGNDPNDEGDARYLGVVAPSYLGRARFAHEPGRPAPLRFDEPPPRDAADLPWLGGAALLIERAIAAHRRFGWHVAAAGFDNDQGLASSPADARFISDGRESTRSAAALTITERREAALERAGIASPRRLPGRNGEMFLMLPSLFLPNHLGESGPLGARAALEKAASRLPYTFAVTRFAHFLKVMQRRKLGGHAAVRDMEIEANEWLSGYIAWQADAGPRVRAEKPLRSGSIRYEEIPTSPGVYRLKIRLQPHHQVEFLGVDLVLSSSTSVVAPER